MPARAARSPASNRASAARRKPGSPNRSTSAARRARRRAAPPPAHRRRHAAPPGCARCGERAPASPAPDPPLGRGAPADDEPLLHQLRRDGIDPGAMPPISAWCARLATKPIGDCLRPPPPEVRKTGRDHRDVGAGACRRGRVVEDGDVPGGPGGEIGDGADRLRHRAQVDRDVRRLRQQLSPGVEDGAAVVRAFLDVGRQRRVAQRRAHLLGDGGGE